MRCLVCQKLSFKLICTPCQKERLVPHLSKRELGCGLSVISFYKFSEIEFLLKTKYTKIGSSIFKILAKNSFEAFSKSFEFDSKIYALSVDDSVKNGFSHAAVLAKHAKGKAIEPYYSKLIAKNNTKYAGKNLEFRLSNPKGFEYSGKPNIDVILIDDTITTGTTLCEAQKAVEKGKSRVLFALTLADAKE